MIVPSLFVSDQRNWLSPGDRMAAVPMVPTTTTTTTSLLVVVDAWIILPPPITRSGLIPRRRKGHPIDRHGSAGAGGGDASSSFALFVAPTPPPPPNSSRQHTTQDTTTSPQDKQQQRIRLRVQRQEQQQQPRQSKPSRFSQSVHEKRSSYKHYYKRGHNDQGGPRQRRSIEELEDTMTKRWGTERSKWIARDNDDNNHDDDGDDDNLFYDDEDEEYDEIDDNDIDVTSTFSSSSSSSSLRPRRVQDPWEKEEDSKISFKKQKKQKRIHKIGTTTKTDRINSQLELKGALETVALQRVRRNQERLLQDRRREQEQQHKQQQRPPPSRWDGDSDDHDTAVWNQDSLDHENGTYSSQGYFFRRPTVAVDNVATQDGKGNQLRNGNDNNKNNNKASTDKNTVGATDSEPNERKRQEVVPSIPLTDDHGVPLYLTLEQAEENFRQGLLVAKDNHDSGKGQVDDDDDEQQQQQVEEPGSIRLGVDASLIEENSDNALASIQTWQDVGITHPLLLDNLKKINCASPLSVQAKACPAITQGNDVVIGTYTGSGKTLAFLVPLIQQLLITTTASTSRKSHHLKILIIAPGRELASQIVSVARQVLEGTGLTALIAIGGTTFARNLEQIRKRKPEIVIGTPGRIAELVVGRPGMMDSGKSSSNNSAGGGGRLKTSSLQALVLDEFDALLEYQPHSEPTLALLETLQQQRRDQFPRRNPTQNPPNSSTTTTTTRRNQLQSILCSATASDVLESPKVINFLRPGFALAMADDNDAFVTSTSSSSSSSMSSSSSVAATSTPPPPPRVSKTVIHGVVHVPHRRLMLETLRKILHTEPYPQQILIFVQDSRKVDMIVERLYKVGILAAPLHGGQSSEKMDRAEVNKALREGEVGIVVATELAARGLDAPMLTHVINVDLPTDSSHYAHRAGRCGRGRGRPGVVINLTCHVQERNVPLKLTQQLGVDLYTVEVRNGKLNLVQS